VPRAIVGDRDALCKVLPLQRPELEADLRATPPCQGPLDAVNVLQVTHREAFVRIGRLETQRRDAFPGWLKQIPEDHARAVIRVYAARKQSPPRSRLHGPGGGARTASLDVRMRALEPLRELLRDPSQLRESET
jgi:hypothetical protein